MRLSTPHERSSARGFQFRVLRFASLAVLAAGVTVAAHGLAAQQAAASAQPSSSANGAGASSQEISVPDAELSEREENNIYRHTPIVQWLANRFHLDVETAARIFEFSNFVIIVLAIGIPLFRFLPRYLRQRKEKLQEDIESARKVTEDANARLSAVEAKLSKLGEEIQKFRAEVEAESLQDEARIKASLAEESTRIVESAEQEIGMAAAQARRGLRNFAADLAIDQAAKSLVLTAETDRALIAEFVGDVVRNGAAGGGKN